MVIVLVLVILVILVIVIKNNKNNKEIIDNPEPIPGIYIDPNLKPTQNLETEQGHEIKIIYKDKVDSFIWKCPNCEVENRSTNKKCYVCNHNI